MVPFTEKCRIKYDLESVDIALDSPVDAVLDLDHALSRLAAVHSESAELVKLHFSAGLEQHEAALALRIPRRTADRHWSFARAFLFNELDGEGGAPIHWALRLQCEHD